MSNFTKKNKLQKIEEERSGKNSRTLPIQNKSKKKQSIQSHKSRQKSKQNQNINCLPLVKQHLQKKQSIHLQNIPIKLQQSQQQKNNIIHYTINSDQENLLSSFRSIREEQKKYLPNFHNQINTQRQPFYSKTFVQGNENKLELNDQSKKYLAQQIKIFLRRMDQLTKEILFLSKDVYYNIKFLQKNNLNKRTFSNIKLNQAIIINENKQKCLSNQKSKKILKNFY